MADVLDRAVTLGAPLVAGPLSREIDGSWTEQLARLGVATSLAKARNVTLALRNAAATFAASTHDCKRVAKEADSAWLRFGPEPVRLDAASDPAMLEPNTVLLWSDAGLQSEALDRRNHCGVCRLSRASRNRRLVRRSDDCQACAGNASLAKRLRSHRIRRLKCSTADSVFRAWLEPAFSQVGAARLASRQA